MIRATQKNLQQIPEVCDFKLGDEVCKSTIYIGNYILLQLLVCVIHIKGIIFG